VSSTDETARRAAGLTHISPDRLVLGSYPCIVTLGLAEGADVDTCVRHDIASQMDRARALVLEHILGEHDVGHGTPRLELAFNQMSYAESGAPPASCVAGAGVLGVTAGSVKMAMGVFADGVCIAVADCVLIQAGTAGQRDWTEHAKASLTSLSWRYLGLPAN
jgi:hypothetical protein